MTSSVKSMTKEQRAEFQSAIEQIKTGDYHGTAVKVELEAQLNRGSNRFYEGNADEWQDCPGCDGDASLFCEDCTEDGYSPCPNECEEGWVNASGEEGDETRCPNEDCEDGYINCVNPLCDEGTVTCSECDGEGQVRIEVEESDEPHEYSKYGRTWSEETCKQFLLDHVPTSAKEALIFSHFYYDGSVDSEFTFTLPIDNAHMAVYFIEAFNLLAEAVGHGLNTSRAGMHTAILNSPHGNYPGGNNLDGSKHRNFCNAMIPLMPALYFLASPDRESRALGYRGPNVGTGKSSAINGGPGCYEFRVFETCYKRPLAFIDNLIVIANCLKYYKATPTDTSMKLGELGFKDGTGLERFYYSVKHVEALERGLKILKPQYKSVAQLMKERNLEISKDKLIEKERKLKQDWAKEFDDVKQRRRYERLRLYHRGLAEAYQKRGYGEDVDVKEFARKYRNEMVKAGGTKLKGSCRQYVKDQAQKFQTEGVSVRINV